MSAKTLMIQGTASSVGKSIMVTALCRIFRQDGFSVAPFKSQNMSNNSFVTAEGGEIGRAQAVQAEACGIEPSIYMNPVLLKPEADNRSQVIVLGKVNRTVDAREYYKYTPLLADIIKDSLQLLRRKYDIIVIEGAGSPAEINLKDTEIANMRVAKMAKSPVLLVGDIDRGGVFASLVGTLELLDKSELKLVKGFIINKFRGEKRLLMGGVELLQKRTGLPVLGIIPYFSDISIAQEDAVFLEDKNMPPGGGDIKIAIIHLPRISNYDDFDPLQKLGCHIRYIQEPRELDGADLIIIPGTKSTIADLNFIRDHGLDREIMRKAKSGIPVLGVCGGFQMLGEKIYDVQKTESSRSYVNGLGLLKITTNFSSKKITNQVKARVVASGGIFRGLQGHFINGYEIHMGNSQQQKYPSIFEIVETHEGRKRHLDGAINSRGNIAGTYLHGIFHNADFAKGFVNRLRSLKELPRVDHDYAGKEAEYDKLARLVRKSIALKEIYTLTLGRKHI